MDAPSGLRAMVVIVWSMAPVRGGGEEWDGATQSTEREGGFFNDMLKLDEGGTDEPRMCTKSPSLIDEIPRSMGPVPFRR